MTAEKDLNKIIAERERHQKAVRTNTTERLKEADRRLSADRAPQSFLFSRDLKDRSGADAVACHG